MIPEIKSAAELEEAIDQLEKTKEEQKENLGDSLHNKMESLKPRNIIKSSVAELQTNAPLKKKIAVGAATALSVYLLKRVLPRRWSGGLQLVIASAVISAIVQVALENKNKHQASPKLQEAE